MKSPTHASGSELDQDPIGLRPPGRPLMNQTWSDLLFLHWPIPAERIQQHLPPELEVDTFDGQAWIALVPFTMTDIRGHGLPSLPGLRAMHELNVRTYVVHEGVPGVWFFSLDAAHPLMVWGARWFFHLPYLRAGISLQRHDDRIRFRSRRQAFGAPAATLDLTWQALEPLEPSTDGSLDSFLTERYCLYTVHETRILRGRIYHPRWSLRRARIDSYESTMLASPQFGDAEFPPQQAMLHHADRLEVEIWRLETVATTTDARRFRTGRALPASR